MSKPKKPQRIYLVLLLNKWSNIKLGDWALPDYSEDGAVGFMSAFRSKAKALKFAGGDKSLVREATAQMHAGGTP